MNNENVKEQTQGKRTVQGIIFSSGDSRSSARVDGTSDSIGSESFSSTGENRQEGNKTQPIICATVGKLIDRLIDSWKDRKQEANDCLDWYNNQVSRCDKEIELLQLIKEDLAQESAPE